MPARKDSFSEDFRRLRDRINATQQELADMLGLSTKAVQSYEQGWRNPPAPIRRLLNVVSVALGDRSGAAKKMCWQVKRCPTKTRKDCRAYRTRQGYLCWLVTGTRCNGMALRNCAEKEAACRECPFYIRFVRGGQNPSPTRPPKPLASGR